MPIAHVNPATAADMAAALAAAREAGQRVVPQGSGTKRTWLRGVSPHEALSTQGLTGTLAHYAGDLVATIPAGMTLSDANATLALARQWLPLDPPFAGRATIGGIVATNDSGPRRHKYGAPRDLIVGVEVALADGRVARAGGRVVKNVAGYDLSRLMCGSYGSLGIITSATFKLAPMAPASLTVVADCPTLAVAVELTQALSLAPMTPSALEIEAPNPRLLIRFETTSGAAERMAEAARVLLQARATAVTTMTGDAERNLWDAHDGMPWGDPAAVVKVSILPAHAPRVFEALATQPGLAWTAIGRIALGVLIIRLDGNAPALINAVTSLRAAAAPGHVTLLTVRESLGHQRPEARQPDAVRVMRAVKQRFDPAGVLPDIPVES